MRYALSDINVNKCDNILSKTLKNVLIFLSLRNVLAKLLLVNKHILIFCAVERSDERQSRGFFMF